MTYVRPPQLRPTSCPDCDSENVFNYDNIDGRDLDDDVYVPMECEDCGANWDDVFTYSSRNRMGECLHKVEVSNE
jgi:hypothetical protein